MRMKIAERQKRPPRERLQQWSTKRKIRKIAKRIDFLGKKAQAIREHKNWVAKRMQGVVPAEKLATALKEYDLAVKKILIEKHCLKAKEIALRTAIK